MREAFENFKSSMELEQTKRMRQIGDFVAGQQTLLGQIDFNEKNYQIFQKTSEQICFQMANILELLMLQNSLNAQEEADKNSIALYGNTEKSQAPMEVGDDQEKAAKHFMKSANAFEKNKTALSFKSNILQTGPDTKVCTEDPPKVHIELEKRCQVCQQDANARHHTAKAFKIACLKYQSSNVSHYGHTYERLKLIKIQESLIEQHCQQIKAIVGGKAAMEKSRDIHRVGSMHQYKIKMQDFGIHLDKDECYTIGKKVLGIDSGRREEEMIDSQKMNNPT